jgi:hypothetical protein
MIEPQVFNAVWSLIDDGERICLQDFTDQSGAQVPYSVF